jgi:hypothetical protein
MQRRKSMVSDPDGGIQRVDSGRRRPVGHQWPGLPNPDWRRNGSQVVKSRDMTRIPCFTASRLAGISRSNAT